MFLFFKKIKKFLFSLFSPKTEGKRKKRKKKEEKKKKKKMGGRGKKESANPRAPVHETA